MHTLTEGKLTINWLRERYRFGRLVAAGGFGIVVEAHARITTMDVIIKFQLDNAEQLVREGRIHRMLTDLWTDNGVDSTVEAPIIKVYDYSQYPAVLDDGEFNTLVSQGFADNDKALFAEMLRELSAPSEADADDEDYPDDEDETDVKAKNAAPAKRITVSFLVEEKIDATLEQLVRVELHSEIKKQLPNVYADPALLRDILAQVLLTLSMLQWMVDFVHGDMHAANVFVRILDRPVVFRYAVARNTVVYVNTRVQIKLGDLGMSMVRVHPPMDERYSMPLGNQIPEHSGYYFQDEDRRVFRPWQDLQRLGGDLAAAIDPFQWSALLPLGINRVLAAMIDLHNTNEVVVTPEMFEADMTDAERANFEAGVKKWWRSKDDARFKLTMLLDDMTQENAKDTTNYIANFFPLSEEFAHYVFSADQTKYFPTPRGVFEQTADVWRALFDYMPPNDLAVVDMTLSVGDRSPGTAPTWNIRNGDDDTDASRSPAQTPLQPLSFDWLRRQDVADNAPPEQRRYDDDY